MIGNNNKNKLNFKFTNQKCRVYNIVTLLMKNRCSCNVCEINLCILCKCKFSSTNNISEPEFILRITIRLDLLPIQTHSKLSFWLTTRTTSVCSWLAWNVFCSATVSPSDLVWWYRSRLINHLCWPSSCIYNGNTTRIIIDHRIPHAELTNTDDVRDGTG